MTNREKSLRRRDFVRGQKYACLDLRAELTAAHFATAYRIVHTLKSASSLINEEYLEEVSEIVVQKLKNKVQPTDSDIHILDEELNRVINEIVESGVMDDEILNTPPKADEQILLFNNLQTLLEDNNAACTELIPEISLIPETKILVRQIETFNFEHALITLQVLREILQV